VEKLKTSQVRKNIFIEPVEESGLGIAIMDRVKKAAYRYNKTVVD